MNQEAVEQVKRFACQNKCPVAQLEAQDRHKICTRDLKNDEYFWVESQCLLFEINCQGQKGKQKIITGAVANVEMYPLLKWDNTT